MQVDVVRVFTRGTEGGNHLGIVDQVLATAEMQSIASDVGYSETIFLDQSEPEPTVRIFTPRTELLFAGHPLVGVTWWLAQRGREPSTLMTGVGRVRIRADRERARVEAELGQAVAEGVAPPEGLGVTASCAVVEMPLPYILCEVGDPGAVAEVAADPAWEHVYVYARGADDRVRARFFAGGLGVTEDPATGSAAVALAARFDAAGERTGRLLIDQGEEMGHPSRIELAWSGGTATLAGTVVADDPLQIRRQPGPMRTSRQ